MKIIPLTQGKFTVVDVADYERLNRHKWYAAKYGKHRKRYCAMRSILTPDKKRHNIYMHRVILNAPTGVDVDHRDSNGLNNCQSNLRLCNRCQNSRHQRLRSDNKTGFKGVCFIGRNPKKPYWAYITVNGKQFYLGSHRTTRGAARAYDLAALKYHGEFALTNKMLGLLKR